MLAEDEHAGEARRQLTICNACRYCEGYCAVFPALELRTFLESEDITYLANLCHDCRECLDACMYAPPHEFAVDIPTILRKTREDSYVDLGFPRRAARLAWVYPWQSVAVVSALAFVALWVGDVATGRNPLHQTARAGSFYEVVPWLAMLIPALVATLFIIAIVATAAISSWRAQGSTSVVIEASKGWAQGLSDALRLRYLRGGGAGCPYPDRELPTTTRRRLHHCLVYGVLAAFLSTCAAGLYQDVLGRNPPYPLWSAPVVLGILGGLGILVGATGMIAMRALANRRGWERSGPQGLSFLVDLDLVAASGLALLAARDTAAMGSLLDVHLALVFGLFLTLPYSKFVHAAHRLASLIRYGSETAEVAGKERMMSDLLPSPRSASGHDRAGGTPWM